MKIKKSSFIISAVEEKQYPVEFIPEIVFVGRSNVGKSSLINMLLNRRSLARTSSSPGKTRTINFYDIDSLFRIVDVPGYGYAKASKSLVSSWEKFINEYLTKREHLLQIFNLIDIRRDIQSLDEQTISFVRELGYSPIIILTKADKIGKGQINKKIELIKNNYSVDKKDIIVVSSLNKMGKYEFWDKLNSIFSDRQIPIKIERQNA